jgi:RNA polymerase sigma factor (sigma-70 family)
MATSQIGLVIRHLRTAALEAEGPGLTDGQLLECFVSRCETAGLEVLVRRHGPMVWGVCRRILGNYHDAEEAFQATFLVLMRKAGSVTPKEIVGYWLYGVAHQTALKAKATRAKRRMREAHQTTMSEPAVAEPNLWSDLQPVLDRELSLLPDKYRAVVVLCDLEGKSRREAARQLGCAEGTVGSRLARARTMLAKRLARHGLAVSAAALAAVLSQKVAWAGVPSLMSSTIKAVTSVAAGDAGAAGLISAEVAALTEGVINAMMITKLKGVVAVTVAMVLTLGIASGLLGGGTAAGRQAESKNASAVAPQKKRPQQPDQAPLATAKEYSPQNSTILIRPSDQFGDPAPEGALARQLSHGDSILAVAVSEDGQMAATAGVNSRLILWDLPTGKERLRLQGHRGAVTSVKFLPGGKLLASAGCERDQTVRLWDLATGKEVQLLKADPEGLLFSLAVSPDGKLLAAGDFQDVWGVPVWDLATGKRLHTLRNGGGPPKNAVDRENMAAGVHCVAFSPDSKVLAIGEHSGREFKKFAVVFWNPLTGKKLRALPMDRYGVHSIAFAPDGNMLACTGMTNQTLDFLDVESGTKLFDLPCAPFGVIAFSPDGKTIACTAKKEGICLWEISTRQLRRRFTVDATDFAWRALAFSPDGRTLISSGGRTALVRDITGLRHDAKMPPMLTADQLQALWKALAVPNAEEAGLAIWSLTADPKKTVPFVLERLRELPKFDGLRIRQLIANLDSESFKVRDTAEKGLHIIGKPAEPALREALQYKLSLETNQRIARLLKKRESSMLPADMLQWLRAIEVLEHIGSLEAKQALEQFAKQTTNDYYRHEAQAALQRLKKSTNSRN